MKLWIELKELTAEYKVTLNYLNARMAMLDLQLYHPNLDLIKNMENSVVNLIQKPFCSDNFTIVTYKQEIRFCRENTHKNSRSNGYL